MKTCSKCQNPKFLTQFCTRRKSVDRHDGWCRKCKRTATEKWRKSHRKQIAVSRRHWRQNHRAAVLIAKTLYRQRHPERAKQQVRNAHQRWGKVYRRRRYFKGIEKLYGVTKAQVQAHEKKQKHRCAVCRQKQKCGKRRRLYVDHDHKTGKFRGLTCFSCNSMLGFAKDSVRTLQNAVRYLRARQ